MQNDYMNVGDKLEILVTDCDQQYNVNSNLQTFDLHEVYWVDSSDISQDIQNGKKTDHFYLKHFALNLSFLFIFALSSVPAEFK